MPSLLVQVKAKMALHAHEKVRGLLEGEYGSVFKGRSMDFDDLREYAPGDDVKDIDWKATARSGTTLIRRYVAVRKHNILLVVDTGRSMAATGSDGDNKRDVSVMTAGVLSYIALKHGDLVGLVAGDAGHSSYLPFKGNTPHVEHLLQSIHAATSLTSAPSNIVNQLEYIAKNLRRKMMIIVISDDHELTAAHQHVLRRLRAQHEILWLSIGDASGLDDDEWYDIDAVALLPYSIRRHRQFRETFMTEEAARLTERTRQLERLGIVSERITGDTAVVPTLFRALERQKHARR